MGDETRYESVTALPTETAPALVTKRSRRRPSARAFEVFRHRVVEQMAPADVAKKFCVSQARVRFLVLRVAKWAREHEGVGDVLAMKIQHTAMLYELWRDARAQYRRSCEDATNHSIVTVEGLLKKDGTPAPKKTTTRVSKKGQGGNPRYLEICASLLASIRGIWGADAPKQMDISTTDEHVTVVTITDRAALALAKIDEELSRRGCVLDAECSEDDAGNTRSDRGGDANGPSEGA